MSFFNVLSDACVVVACLATFWARVESTIPPSNSVDDRLGTCGTNIEKFSSGNDEVTENEKKTQASVRKRRHL